MVQYCWEVIAVPDPIDYATPPAPPGPKEGELDIVLLLFNVAGIVGGVCALLLGIAFTGPGDRFGEAAAELWIFYSIVEVPLSITTICLKRVLRHYAFIGLSLVAIIGLRYSAAVLLGH